MYEIIQKDDLISLEKEVRRLRKLGYKCLGGVVPILIDSNNDGYGETTYNYEYLQTMEKIEKVDEGF